MVRCSAPKESSNSLASPSSQTTNLANKFRLSKRYVKKRCSPLQDINDCDGWPIWRWSTSLQLSSLSSTNHHTNACRSRSAPLFLMVWWSSLPAGHPCVLKYVSEWKLSFERSPKQPWSIYSTLECSLAFHPRWNTEASSPDLVASRNT